MEIIADGIKFLLPNNTINAFVFDETDKTKSTFHGVEKFKAVDLVIEYNDKYLYVEIKDYMRASLHGSPKDGLEILKYKLKDKYLHSYIYRSAEDKVDKPIYYVCLLMMEEALLLTMLNLMKQLLPIGIPQNVKGRWKHEILHDLYVVNIDGWNHNFERIFGTVVKTY